MVPAAQKSVMVANGCSVSVPILLQLRAQSGSVLLLQLCAQSGYLGVPLSYSGLIDTVHTWHLLPNCLPQHAKPTACKVHHVESPAVRTTVPPYIHQLPSYVMARATTASKRLLTFDAGLGQPCCCLIRFKQELTIFGSVVHMHGAGRTAITTHTRNNRALEPLVTMHAFDFPNQGLSTLPANSGAYPVVKPGDEISLTCVYDTRGRSKDTVWGYGYDGEMCMWFLTYYPAQPGRCMHASLACQHPRCCSLPVSASTKAGACRAPAKCWMCRSQPFLAQPMNCAVVI